MRAIIRAIILLLAGSYLLFTSVSTVFAQVYPPTPTPFGGAISPFPTMPLCSLGPCDDVCGPDTCYDDPNDGLLATCTPFCNNDTEYCAFTCSTFQGTCTTGWGDWGACSNCWQFRVCNDNLQLGQTQYCCNPTGPGGTGFIQPTEPPVPSLTPTATPTPITGTIYARAVRVDAADTSCTAVKAVPITDGNINGTTHQFTLSSASNPAPQAQTGANYVTFANIQTGSYTIDAVPPTADWAFARSCWTYDNDGVTGEGLSRTLGVNNQNILRWDLGYTLGTAWAQTQGGDVYAAGMIRSFIPDVIPREFNLEGSAGYPGVVTYGAGYDFDSEPLVSGDTLVSSTNWKVNSSRSRINYYDFFFRRFGSPTTPTTDPAFNNLQAVTKPPSSATPYYVVGDITTSGNWGIADGETIVIIVNGNVTIGGNIRFTGTTGFFALISNGTISVSSAIGRTTGSTVPNLEGVYVAMNEGHTGRFETGASVAALTARFIGSGMFIADEFLLQRDLDGFGVGNAGASSELFIYNPRLLISMPDAMKELSVSWQEVAP